MRERGLETAAGVWIRWNFNNVYGEIWVVAAAENNWDNGALQIKHHPTHQNVIEMKKDTEAALMNLKWALLGVPITAAGEVP